MCTPAHLFASNRGNLYCHDLCFLILNQISLFVSLPLAAVLPRRLRPSHTHVRFKQCSVFVVVILVSNLSTSAYNNLQQHGQNPNGVISNSLRSTSAIVRHSPSATICARRLPWGHPSPKHDTFTALMTISYSDSNTAVRHVFHGGTLPALLASQPCVGADHRYPRKRDSRWAGMAGGPSAPVKRIASTLLFRG
jgi:hypothetical protein